MSLANDSDGELLYSVEDHVARITLNRPQRLNALSIGMRRRWAQVVAELNRDPMVRAGVLMGAGDKAFCVGADLKEMAVRDAAGKRRAGAAGRPLMPEKPMVAAVHGYCFAGGLELALMCDVRIAAADATFAQPEVRRSLIPVPAVSLLPGLIGRGEAALLLLTGDAIDAERALRIGLVQGVVPGKDDAEAEALRIASAMALGAPLAARAIKDILWTNSAAGEHAWRYAREHLARVQASEDAKEGPRAFAEKRAPRWKGR